jgi:hypothetical protein
MPANKLFKTIALLAALALACLAVSPAQAQQEEQLRLSLSRTFGYSSGFSSPVMEIQGVFNLRAQGPDDLERVIFYLDDQVINEVTSAPFNLSFTTDPYPLGEHTFSATGYTAGGRELHSNIIRVEFTTAQRGMEVGLKIVGPLFAIIIGAMLLSALVTALAGRNRKPLAPGARRSYGPLGGTVCRKCGRSFALEFLAPNMLVGKLQRCPHCGKWATVRRASPAELEAAEQAELEAEQGANAPAAELTEEERLRKELDSSRFSE